MKSINIVVGTDHRGYHQKEMLREAVMIGDYFITWHDVGCFSVERTDYPIFAQKAVHAITQGECQLGVLLCGTGIGMSITANRYKGIYAGLAWSSGVAQKAREDDNCNILVIPIDYVESEQIVPLVQAWLMAEFKGGRYAQRLAMIDAI